MKKSLVTAAALIVAGTAALAQSSVSLYGRIDASIASQKTEVGGSPTADKGAQLRAGAHTGNRWGLKGSEQLGGGLKVNFQLEQGFNVDDGTSASALQFHRQAWVGLSGAFGALQVGRQVSTIYDMYTEHDPLAYSSYSAMVHAFNAGAYANLSRIDNAVVFGMPAIGGFSAGALWAPGENKNGAAGTRSATVGLQALYGNGPLSIGAAWERQTFNVFANTTAWEMGASYDLGVAKLFGQVEGARNNATNARDSGYQIGVRVPFGAPSLALSYASEDLKTAGTRMSTASAYSLLAQYPLSKRTYVYAAFLRGTTDPTVGATTRQRNYGLGLVHNF